MSVVLEALKMKQMGRMIMPTEKRQNGANAPKGHGKSSNEYESRRVRRDMNHYTLGIAHLSFD